MTSPTGIIDTDTQKLDRPISEHPCHGWFTSAGDRLTHRHWFQDGELMPTCERCGTGIDREHKETGPISWGPEKRREVITLADRHAISKAAMTALGEWLAWPDAGRDGPREVTVQQTLSFLRGLPNSLGYEARLSDADARVNEAVERARGLLIDPTRDQYLDAQIDDDWDHPFTYRDLATIVEAVAIRNEGQKP